MENFIEAIVNVVGMMTVLLFVLFALGAFMDNKNLRRENERLERWAWQLKDEIEKLKHGSP